ncbi:translation initiation factor IF-2 [candidate division KSB1 bacterium]|nr:translation initiation factor IF-2 [candidate division KSB1 bacterium]
MAVKKRVFQVAREFNISNEALVEYLHKLGYDIRNHMSLLSDEAYGKAVEKFGETELQHDSEYEFRRRLKEKKAAEEAKKQQARDSLERRLKVAKDLAEEMPRLKRQREEEHEAEPPKEEKTAPPPEAKPSAPPSQPEEKPEEKPKKPKRKLKVVEIPPEEAGARTREKPRPEPAEKPEAEPSKAPSEAEPKPEAKPQGPDGKPKEKEEEEGAERKKKRKRRRRKKRPAETEEEPQITEKKDRKRKKKRHRPVFDEAEIQENIRQTLANIDDTAPGKTRKRKRRIAAEEEEAELEPQVIKVSEYMSLSELSNLMNVESTELIKKCMELGMMVTINQRLDMDTITLLASEYGFQVEALEEFGEDILEEMEEEEEGTLLPRPPVVTIMGHVDHGKTSLLDHIRKSNIIAGEAGGITQHIGAYEVTLDHDKNITFLDTPGHEAFTAMRARGAQATDIVVLVVAADDSVMPQTIEAISHAKAADVPIVVAVNKIDKPGANPDLIRKQLSEHGVLVEQWGGKYQAVEISAKTGENLDSLLESILLEAEILDLKANPDRKAKGVIIESKLDRGKGPVATVLVQAGTLTVGDPFVSGTFAGKVRSMFDERGKRVKSAGPSVPVQVLGFDGLPQAGDSFVVLESERDTRDISQKRQQLQREHEHWRSRPRTLDEISRQIAEGQVRQLSVVVKADVDGSIQAIIDSLMKLATKEVAVDVIHRGVGAISESDVLLASASGAIIIGFNVRPTSKARELAAKESVDIRQYEVIYDILNDIKAALEGFLTPDISEELVGTAEVRQVFKVPKVGMIAGCYINSGKINRNDNIKVYRDDRLIHDGRISSLKRFKEDVRDVATGFECGIGVERFDDLKVNDVIEAYHVVETKRTLEQSTR